MRIHRTGRFLCWSLLLTAVSWSGCRPPVGGGNGTRVRIGDGPTGGFQDNGLEPPGMQPVGRVNLPPTGDLVAPVAGAELARGDVLFEWTAADPDETNVDSTLHFSDESDVFDHPLYTTGVRTSPTEIEHELSVRFPYAGTFYWGVAITDGVNTIRLPETEVGVAFEVKDPPIIRTGADVDLLCPGTGQPARAITTFSWSLRDTVPRSTQIFVSRAGEANPFESPLRVFDVPTPTAEQRALSEAEALPLGVELSWGLRIETADEILFTGEGQLGVSFVVEQNVPPSGEFTGPDDGAVLADNTPGFTLSWDVDPGNCEDVVTSTVFFELPNGAEEPAALFDSAIQLPVAEGAFQADLVASSSAPDLAAGTWAWGVVGDDGTDQAQLAHGELPDRLFRTFIRNTAPRFLTGPSVAQEVCEPDSITDDAVVFSYEDGNGADSVNVTLTFAMSEDLVFDSPTATLTLPQAAGDDATSTETVFVQSDGTLACPQFVHGVGFYGVELDDGVNDVIRGVVEHAGPPMGACCATGGGCTDGVLEDCLAGEYRGDGTMCALVDCPIMGACCATDGGCTDGVVEDCLAGEYRGDGTMCALVDCRTPPPPIMGACCAKDGSCTEGLIGDCLTGDYQGDGTTCAPEDCPVTITDCNENGVDDVTDIAAGTSDDCDLNAIPDECEGSPIVVDAGVLKPGIIDAQSFYDSARDPTNDLIGTICPPMEAPVVLWTFVSGPSVDEIPAIASIRDSGALATSYFVNPAWPGEYVFQLTLTLAGTSVSDTVTLTLTSPQ